MITKKVIKIIVKKNLPPVIEGLEDSYEVYDDVSLGIAFKVSDPEGKPVNVTAEGLPEGASVVNTDGNCSLLWAEPTQGTYQITIVADDGEG